MPYVVRGFIVDRAEGLFDFELQIFLLTSEAITPLS
jgi:hypothetical protein